MSTKGDRGVEKGKLCAGCEGRTLESVNDITNSKDKAKAHMKGAVAMLRVYENVKDKTPKEDDTAPAPASTPTAAVLPALFLSVNK
tara:strand:- start:110 stop:367 length:258 start_codon:yes stop_codon:yes gene_type:complete